MKIFVLAFLVLNVSAVAFGWPRARRSSGTTQNYSTQSSHAVQSSGASSSDLQAIAQARASAMAQNDRFQGHYIPGAPAKPSNVFEGVGYSTNGQAPTCQGSGRVIADASATSASGKTYRVRFYSH